ncbi:MAG: type III-B CRISPR module-associated Cmr3 family protein [Pseudonocardiaceae bacterium]
MSRNAGVTWLAFTPRDTLFIRDGRGFDAGAQTNAHTVRPAPTTLAGATGAAFGAEPTEVRGPVLAVNLGSRWESYFPVPLDLVCQTNVDESYVYRLAPESAGTASTDLDVQHWLLPPDDIGRTEDLPGWLPAHQLAGYLAGTLPAATGTPKADLHLADPLHPEPRVGLAREADRSAKPGYLYQATHLRPDPGWAFAAGCVLPVGWDRLATGPVPFGGRGRLADVETVDRIELPAPPSSFPGGRVLVYLATPAIWPGGWRIPIPDGARLVTAAAGEPQPVATTTPGPRWKDDRVLRWAAPAGSVYLLQFDDQDRAAEWATGVHGTAYGRAADDRLRTAGFGLVLTGKWM